jgi:pentose-5-phosphate-3-epimerase
MVVITPTITTDDVHKYREQMEKIATIADGVHLDFADGVFAPNQLLPIDEAWRSEDLVTHAHIMYQKPLDVIDEIMHLEADLVVLHAESDDIKRCLELLLENGTRTGIALLPETSLADLKDLEIDDLFDHVLVFGGRLGFQGGSADLDQLDKVKRIKSAYPDMEIAWDGGVDDKNIKQIVAAGVSVVNVGGFIKNSHYPKNAYDTLVSLVQS